MLLPGPEAQQLATSLGWLMHRTWGGIAAGVLFVLPSLFILVALSWVYLRFGQVGPVAAVFWGLKPAVTAVVLQAAWRLGARTLHNRWLMALAVAAFAALTFADLPFPAVVGAALAAAAALALMRLKVGTVKVLLACALAGCAAHLLGLQA
jgi:chromate transporter